MADWLSKEEQKRWNEIKLVFAKNQELQGYGEKQQIAMIANQIEAVTKGLGSIRDAITKNNDE